MPHAFTTQVEVKTELSAPTPPEASENWVYTTDVGNWTCTAHGLTSHTVPLEEGPGAFLIAQFSWGCHVTELPNLLFRQKKAKAPKAKAAMKAVKVKKPKAMKAMKAMKAKKMPEAAAHTPNKYTKMWYKNGWNIGIRQMFGEKKQIFSFGGKRCEKSEEQLKLLATEIVNDLQGGMDPDEACRKAKEAAAA